jgi:50S ribosomal protein L16 3-hydroxylase
VLSRPSFYNVRMSATPPIEIDARGLSPLGMSSAQFLKRYWQRRPLLIRNAFPGFVSPISPDELAGLACEPDALARIVRRERLAASDDPAQSRWHLQSGPFAESDFASLPSHDCSLLVQDVDKWDADVAPLLDAFAFLPRWRIDDIMISFAEPGGSVGPHVDQYDVFLLQAHGRRRWQIDSRSNADTAMRTDSELKLLRRFTPDADWLLQPGDMLYLPPGMPHHGEAVDACLTLSVGMRAPAAGELVGDLAEHLAEAMAETERYRDPDLTPAKDPFEIDAAAMTRLRTALGPLGSLDERTLRDWFGAFITRYRSAALPDAGAKPKTPEALARMLGEGRTLARHPFARSAWTRDGRRGRLFVAGESWAMGVRSASALAAARRIDAAAFAVLDRDAHAALSQLLARGWYQLQRRTRSRP